jgi:hypothetical protein
MMIIDRLTQHHRLEDAGKQKIIEGVSMKCFCVFSHRKVYDTLYIGQW